MHEPTLRRLASCERQVNRRSHVLLGHGPHRQAVARDFKVSRGDQDAFARPAIEEEPWPRSSGKFADEMRATVERAWTNEAPGRTYVVDTDGPRADTSLEKLAKSYSGVRHQERGDRRQRQPGPTMARRSCWW